MQGLSRAIYILAVGIVLALVVHLVVVLAIPAFAERDAWQRLSATGETWEFQPVAAAGTGTGPLGPTDAHFGSIACRFDLSQDALVVRAEGQLPFWSASIFTNRGQNIYSFNDRTAVGGQLFLLVLSPIQMARLRADPPAEAEQAVVVEADMEEGFVIVRALQEDESWRERVSNFLQAASCERFQLPNASISGEPDLVIEDAD
jgi:uncharacterized membrane protein